MIMVETITSPVEYEGRVARAVIIREPTERRQLDVALREANERFRLAFDGAPIGMALVGLDGRWLQVNPALCEIVGYPADELLTTTFQDITHPDDLEADLGLMHKVLADEIASYSIEKRYFHADGHVVWINLAVSLVRDTAGHRCTSSRRSRTSRSASGSRKRCFASPPTGGSWTGRGGRERASGRATRSRSPRRDV